MAKKTEAQIELNIQGRKHTIQYGDLTGADVRDFRAELGFGPLLAFTDPSKLDLDVVAGLVWLERRRREPGLTYDAVASSITFDSIEIDDAAPADDEPDDPNA